MSVTETRARELTALVAGCLASSPGVPLRRTDLQDIAAVLDAYAGGFAGLGPAGIRCLQAMQGWFDDHGYPPTIRDLQRRLGLASKSSVVFLLGQLEERGYIERPRGRARALRIIRRVPGRES
ncbi:LexA DNA binding domain-containing protein [Tistlia consotensis]|uniref:LexA family protein n=1 Tax=Tistlia consotensis TaxID=1321365 RepID=UPI000B6E5E96|nr:hypothetical protein [Tistlia consotensis]SNS40518.1 LexA DNA binding domain-containing protein [Tistlia consotensis]